MVSFGYNVLFLDEPRIDEDNIDERLPNIPVIFTENISFIDNAIYATPPIEHSGKMVRFYSLIPLDTIKEGDSWAMEIEGRLCLFWDGDKRLITYEKRDDYKAHHLRYWVLHTFLPLLFQLEERYHILHVGCVDVGGKAILLSAPSNGGKSTLVDYFLQHSHGLLSDDSLGVLTEEGRYYAIPSYPFHRPYRAVESLGEYSYNFVETKEEIVAIYILNPSPPDAHIFIKKLNGIQKFRTFGTSAFVKFGFLKKANFEFLAQMANNVTIYTIDVPHDITRLDEVYKEIVSHHKTIE